MATKPSLGTALPVGELATTPATRIRIVIDDLINLILRLQIATRARMTPLPTRPAALTLPACKLLGLRPRLRAPLLTRLRRILRWRLGTRARVLTSLILKPLQPIVMLRKPAREIQNELDTRPTTRVIDRLRLRAVHDRKIRCNKQDMWFCRPFGDGETRT